MNAEFSLDDEGISFRIIGDAVAVDPGTDRLTIAMDALREGLDIDLSATDSGTNETVTGRVRLTLLPGQVEAPSVTGKLAEIVITQASGDLSIDAAAVFAGEGITYSVSGGGAVIDPATGIITLSSDALISGETVIVTGSNSGGAAETGFQFTVKAQLLPPVVTAELPDVLYARGTGAQSVSAQAGFEGSDLEYALVEAPAGAGINATSGLISIPTGQVLRDAIITVRVGNAAGSASQTFLVSVYAAETSFEAPSALEEVSFISENGAPSWTHSADNDSGLLVPATTGHLHGDWRGAKGDGLYRCLAYWNSPNRTDYEYSPFVFGARIARSGGDFTGVYVEAMRPRKGNKYLQIRQYTGNGTETELLDSARPGWMWKVWWWVDVEIDGTSIRARLYREEDPAPDWQVEATTSAADTGVFGPAGFPLNGQSPEILIKKLEFYPFGPGGQEKPQSALGNEWNGSQFTEQA